MGVTAGTVGTVYFFRLHSGSGSRRLKSKLSAALRTAPPRPSPRRGEGYEGPASATRAVGRSRVRGKTVAPRPPHPLGFASGPLPAGERRSAGAHFIHVPLHLAYPWPRSPQTGTRVASRWNGAGAGAGSVALARHWAMSPQVPARPAVRLPPRSPTPVPEGKTTGRAAERSHTLLRPAIFGRPSSPPPPFAPWGVRRTGRGK